MLCEHEQLVHQLERQLMVAKTALSKAHYGPNVADGRDDLVCLLRLSPPFTHCVLLDTVFIVLTISIIVCSYFLNLLCYCPHRSDVRSSFCDHDNSWTAALSSIKFCMNMYVDHRTNCIDFENRRSKVKVTGPDFRILYHYEIGQKVCVHNNSWAAALSLMIFFAWICTSTTFRTLLNFKVKVIFS